MRRPGTIAAACVVLAIGAATAAASEPLVRVRLRAGDARHFLDTWAPLLPARWSETLATEAREQAGALAGAAAAEVVLDLRDGALLRLFAVAPREWPAGNQVVIAPRALHPLAGGAAPLVGQIAGTLVFRPGGSTLVLEARPDPAAGSGLGLALGALEGARIATAGAVPREAVLALMLDWRVPASLLFLGRDGGAEPRPFLEVLGIDDPKELVAAVGGGAAIALLDYDPKVQSQPDSVIALSLRDGAVAQRTLTDWEGRLRARWHLEFERRSAGARALRTTHVPMFDDAYPTYALTDSFFLLGYTPHAVSRAVAALDEGDSLAPLLLRDVDAFALFRLDFDRLNSLNRHLTFERSHGHLSYEAPARIERLQSLVAKLAARGGKVRLEAVLEEKDPGK